MASTISDTSGEIRPVAILGASGRLGTMLRDCWPDDVPLVLHSTKALPGFVPFDLILEPESAARALAGVRAVICLAGVTDARAKSQGDAYARNSELALAAVHAARKAGAGRVFLASSAAVYGAPGGVLGEDTPCRPVSEYGQAKRRMEQSVLSSATDIGQPVTALRIGNVAGADAILGGWHGAMQIDTLPDGSTPKRSYIGPQTLARVLHLLTLQDDLPQVLNVAAPNSVQMGALLDAADLTWGKRPAPDSVIADVTLGTGTLERHVTFRPANSTAAGIVAEWQNWHGQATA